MRSLLQIVLILLASLCMVGLGWGQDLPKCVQKLPPDQYKAWVYWQNAQAKARDNWEPQHLYFDKTTVQRSSGARMHGSSRRFKGRTTRGSTYRDMRTWGITTAFTVPYRYRNPDYVTKPIMYYSPFIKPNVSGVEPDWDNLFIPVDGEVITVTEAITRSTMPVSPETLYRWFIERSFE
jgi:hypothetical protein